MRRRNIQRVLAGALCIAVLTGCGWVTHGTVTGVVRGYGGPSSATDGRPMPNQDFVIEDDHGNRTTVTSDADGRFSVSLAPGKYVMRCGTGHDLTVEARQTVTLDCDYQMA